MPVVHDVVRHPKTGDYATCTVEFKAVTLRDDDGETIGNAVSRAKAYPTPPVESGLDPGEFSINLAEGLYETRLRILGATATEWVRFINPPGGGRYLNLIQAYDGAPEDDSAMASLLAVLSATYAPIDDPRFDGIGGGPNISLTDNGDGTVTINDNGSGALVINGDGTATLTV